MKKETQELIENLESYREYVKSHLDPANHWIRRFFRCYLDGSYDATASGYKDGGTFYRVNCKAIQKLRNSPRKLRAFCISRFMDFLITKYPLSRSTIQKAIVRTIPTDEIEALNKELAADALNMVKELN